MFERILPDEAATLAFGAELAHACPTSVLIYLYGELGAGKTTLVRGFLRGLGFTGSVKSPTYTLVESYLIQKQQIYHFDLYRLRDPRELEFMGIQDYFATPAIHLVEWPERGEQVLPPPDLSCYIEPHLSGRKVRLVALSKSGENLIAVITQGYNE